MLRSMILSLIAAFVAWGPLSAVCGCAVTATRPADDSGTPDAAGQDSLPPVRFVAFGDSGRGNPGQYLVAEAIRAVCAERGGCDFALLLGDNIYDSGVSSVDDAQWQEKFELPYANLEFPFYVTLGNHDLGGFGAGNDPVRGSFQLAYATRSEKFIMPDSHYRASVGLVELVSLNTTSLYYEDATSQAQAFGYDVENQRQHASLAAWNQEASATWRIAFGHHPYRSNGPHGNAGRYDGTLPSLPGSGSALQAFLDAHVLGHFDVYFCGHDHSLQDVGSAAGTALFVSGGGATHTDLPGENLTEWQRDRRGFAVVEASSSALTLTFYVVPDATDAETSYFAAHTRTLLR